MPKSTYTKPGPSKPVVEEEVSLVVSLSNTHLFVHSLNYWHTQLLYSQVNMRLILKRKKSLSNQSTNPSSSQSTFSPPFPSSQLPQQRWLSLVTSSRRNRDTIAEREKELDPDIVEAKRAAEIEKQKEDSKNLVADSIVRELAESEPFNLADLFIAHERGLINTICGFTEETQSVQPDVDDTDGLDPEGEFEEWKLRELTRLKRDKEARYAWVFPLSLVLSNWDWFRSNLSIAWRRSKKKLKHDERCLKLFDWKKILNEPTRLGKKRRKDLKVRFFLSSLLSFPSTHTFPRMSSLPSKVSSQRSFPSRPRYPQETRLHRSNTFHGRRIFPPRSTSEEELR